jgi:hypothetical protein
MAFVLPLLFLTIVIIDLSLLAPARLLAGTVLHFVFTEKCGSRSELLVADAV